MRDPETKRKMVESLKGRTFLSRGGNGAPTTQQSALAKATGLPMEYPIRTAPVAGEFDSLPKCYKVDLADPDVRLAIEVDGKTHLLKKWRFLDDRKTAILNALGWQVLRFTNEEVDSDLNGCLKKIESTTSTLRRMRTTSPTES
ncbi:MAG: endonuclease domain-containing protein [Chloroflexota bacterium]